MHADFKTPNVFRHTLTWLPSCLEEPLLSLCVGEGDVILLQLNGRPTHRVLVSVETVQSEITEDPQAAPLRPLEATPQQSALQIQMK